MFSRLWTHKKRWQTATAAREKANRELPQGINQQIAKEGFNR
jgi:hypothetical protein